MSGFIHVNGFLTLILAVVVVIILMITVVIPLAYTRNQRG